MKILFTKNVIFIFLAFSVTFSFLVFQFIKQTDFYIHSDFVTSKVVSVRAENERCGKSRNKPCTRFYVIFEYFVKQKKYLFDHQTTEHGHDFPKNKFKYSLGDTKLLRYYKSEPKKANFESIFAVYAFPLVMLFFSMMFGIAIYKNIKDSKQQNYPG